MCQYFIAKLLKFRHLSKHYTDIRRFSQVYSRIIPLTTPPLFSNNPPLLLNNPPLLLNNPPLSLLFPLQSYGSIFSLSRKSTKKYFFLKKKHGHCQSVKVSKMHEPPHAYILYYSSFAYRVALCSQRTSTCLKLKKLESSEGLQGKNLKKLATYVLYDRWSFTCRMVVSSLTPERSDNFYNSFNS